MMEKNTNNVQSSTTTSITGTIIKYMCSICFGAFETVDGVRQHMIDIHKFRRKTKPLIPVESSPAEAIVETKSEQQRIDSRLKNEWLKPITLKDLKLKLLKNWVYRCTLRGCNFKFETAIRRDLHLKCHASLENIRDFKCFECHQEHRSWRNCGRHLWKTHKVDVDRLTCPLCASFTAVTPVQIFQHLQMHGSTKEFTCPVCSAVFPQYSQLRSHSVTHMHVMQSNRTSSGDEQAKAAPTVNRWYSQKTCHICLNIFANSKTLSKHMKRHNKIVSYRCNICGKGSTSKATWMIHMRQHTGEKPLKCKVCPFNARDPSVLRKHMMRHTLIKPYKCKLCDYSCIQTVPLKIHIRVNHPEEYEKMKCTLCKFISVSQELLERHYKDHKAGLVKSDEEVKNEREAAALAAASQSKDNKRGAHDRMKPNEVSSDCFLPLESTDSIAHDPPLDIGGVTIPAVAHSEDTQFTIFMSNS